MNNKTVAFALGGLAGNNAHGAGFLQAALDKHFKPEIISCTSGQIRWVAHYLKNLGGESTKDPDALKTILQDQINGMRVFPWDCRDADFMHLWCWGVKDVYEPAYPYYVLDWVRNLANSFVNIGYDLTRSWHNYMGTSTNTPATQPKPRDHLFITRRMWEVWPCRLLKSCTSDPEVEKIADQLAKSSIGIVFNSYDPAQGKEHVYLNECARACLKKSSSNKHHYGPGQTSTYRNKPHQETIYHDIDADAVRAALHLYAYGFDPDQPRRAGQLDGAYFRDIILSELAFANHIFVARPMPPRWQGELPKTEVEMQDMQTEVMFKSGYIGEKSQIELVNKLLDDKRMKGKRYRHVELHEIEMKEPRGFFDYCFEDLSVFDYARERGKEELDKVLPPNASPGRPASRRATPPLTTSVPANGR